MAAHIATYLLPSCKGGNVYNGFTGSSNHVFILLDWARNGRLLNHFSSLSYLLKKYCFILP